MLVIWLEHAPKLIEFTLWDRFHHIASVLGVIKQASALATGAQLIQSLVVILHDAVD
jgi:ABC-type uncharacterized transport system auxiliary subunit